MNVADKIIDQLYTEILILHSRIEKEHNDRSPNWLGNPTRRHHELIAQSRILKELGSRIFAMTGKSAARYIGMLGE